VQQWQQQQIPISGIADDLENVMIGSKKLHNEICSQIIGNTEELTDLYNRFHRKIYQDIK
jgi:hypothetical protein